VIRRGDVAYGEEMPTFEKCLVRLVYLKKLYPDANHGAGISKPTKLGDFGQGQMLVNVPAPWSIWDTSFRVFFFFLIA